MKKSNDLSNAKRNLDQLISILSENEILCLQAMSCVRGGDGNGSEPIIIIPPKRP